MKTRKKILLVMISLAITGSISSAIAFGLSAFGLPFWPIFCLAMISQIGGKLVYEYFYESQRIMQAADSYNAKPYKHYLMELNCAHCGHKNEIDIDLTETEFRCENCKKFNGIHISFMTAAISEPI